MENNFQCSRTLVCGIARADRWPGRAVRRVRTELPCIDGYVNSNGRIWPWFFVNGDQRILELLTVLFDEGLQLRDPTPIFLIVILPEVLSINWSGLAERSSQIGGNVQLWEICGVFSVLDFILDDSHIPIEQQIARDNGVRIVINRLIPSRPLVCREGAAQYRIFVRYNCWKRALLWPSR